MIKIDNYTTFHLHSDYSLLDSVTDFKLYVDRAVELGQKAIAFTEHGKISNWVSKKMYCDEKGIKYIHAVECYLTEQLEPKIRDNYHTVLIAKNEEGRRELNRIISKSHDEDHFYYTNRISFDEFLKLSSNIITTSACLASPLNKLDIKHEKYEALVKRYDYLEIQPHNHPEQIAFNVHLAELSRKYNKPLIAGTDTHSLNSYKAECRKILLKRKRQSYGDEDAFDLTYKTYEELVEMFENQNALPRSVWLEAIKNTNKMAELVEDFELDKKIKYPILYGTRENDSRVFSERIEEKLNDKLFKGIIPKEQETQFRNNIKEEKRVFEKIGMDGFMLSMSELLSWCRENEIPTGTARGSVGGSSIAYVTDIIDLNPVTWNTVFSRFCNEDREEIGDIDVDVIESDREKIFNYIIKRFGVDKTARVASYGTIKSAGAIEDICGALKKYWNEERGFKPDENIPDNPYNVKKVKKIKKEFIADEEKTKKQYPEIFYYLDGLLDVKISQSVHPAGMVISPITLDDNYGVFDKDGLSCLMLDMKDVHEIGLAKYDFLVLKNVEIIRDTCKNAGIRFPRSYEIDWEDEAVWKDMLKSPVGIFQMEGEFAFNLLKRFEPKSIFDMSLVTACIRPSGASYREDLISKKPYKNPSTIIDELLKDNNGYLIYQEDTIKFLKEICGLSGSEADNVRRAIGRKEEDRLEAALPSILDGYCNKSDKPRKEAEEEAQAFLTILKDSASYQFGYNHSIAYCMIGYLCAYLRYYYPHEFITAYLNNAANPDDIANGTKLAREYGIKVTSPRFGISRDTYEFDKKSNIIAKGVSSIKFLNKEVGKQLYEIAHTKKLNSFIDVLFALKNVKIDSRQTIILINIDFFSMYGNSRELSRIYGLYEFLKEGEAKKINKDKISPEMEKIIIKYATNIGKNGNELKSYTITDMIGLLREMESIIKSLSLPDIDLKIKIANSLEYLGYIDIATGKEADRKKLLIENITPITSKNSSEPWCYRVNTMSVGSGVKSRLTIRSKIYDKTPIRAGDIIYVEEISKNNRGFWEVYRYKMV